jgi:citrate synthase
MSEVKASGLEGVVAASTRLSDVDGERGRLVIAGRDVEELGVAASFEEVVALLWKEGGRDVAPAAELRAALGKARERAFEMLPRIGDALSLPDGMEALRAATAHLSGSGDLPLATAITGALAVFAAGWARLRSGKELVPPEASLSHAADYLRMVTGSPPDAARAKALDAYLVTVMDHGMNASTFTARVVASTGSDDVSAVVAAIGALKGPLHGGAPGPVLDMLDAIAVPEDAAKWLESEIASGRRIMGMGHRIYRVRDPRAAVLEKATLALEAAGIHTGRLSLARAVEKAAEGVLRAKHPDRPLHANVEFYTAVLLDTLGLPRELFSATFAVGRVGGWLAHTAEQRATGRLIRPDARYVGKVPDGGVSSG